MRVLGSSCSLQSSMAGHLPRHGPSSSHNCPLSKLRCFQACSCVKQNLIVPCCLADAAESLARLRAAAAAGQPHHAMQAQHLGGPEQGGMPPGMAEAQAAAAEAGAMVPGSRKRKQCPSKNCGCPAQKQPCFGLPGVPSRLRARRLCPVLGMTCLQQLAVLYQQCKVRLRGSLVCE